MVSLSRAPHEDGLRELEPMRVLSRETRLSPSDFIYRIFVAHGRGPAGAHRAHARLLPALH